jgi:RecA-family ATPase
VEVGRINKRGVKRVTSKLEHALRLAEAGYYVFPCKENGKTPLVPWTERSTRNPDTIKGWWIPDFGAEHNYNIGIDCGKSGILVVDVDCKNNQPGKENYEKLEKEKGFGKDLYTVHTPSGGLHLYYRNSDFKNTASSVAVGIDTRGIGGYVLAAGSEIDGNAYHGKADTLYARDALSNVPPWLGEALHSSKRKSSEIHEGNKTIVEDNPDDIAAAIEFLQNVEGAVKGSGTGDLDTYKVFCKLKERGVSLETAIDLAMTHWSPNCSPEWDESDLRVKAENAYRYGQNATGALSPLAEFDIPKSDFGAKPEKPQTLSRFSEGFLLPDAKSFPAREWVYGKLALAKNVTLIIAPPGVGKSTLTLGIGLSKASGHNIFGIDTLGKGTVAIFNNEDNIEEQSRRLVAAGLHYSITNAEISDVIDGSRLLLNGRDNAPLTIAKRDKHGKIVAHQAKELTEYLIKHDVKMLIVDPLAMTHPADENKNEEMIIVGNLYAEVANRANCAVILVHHTRKLSQSGSEGHNGNLDSARGASSLGGIVRVAYTLNVMSKADAKRRGMGEDQRFRYLLLEQAKANMSAPGEHQMYFERIGVAVGQDDESVGVLKPANLAKVDMRKDNVKELVIAIEAVLRSRGETKQKDVVAILKADDHALYADTKEGALSTKITRLFPDGLCTGDLGTLYRNKKSVKGKADEIFLSYLPFGKDELDSLI